MKYLGIILITGYQLFLSPLVPHIVGTRQICRFDISCSEYMKKAIEKHGMIRGVGMGLKRISQCQPFLTYGRSI